jgi:hypothetical protein
MIRTTLIIIGLLWTVGARVAAQTIQVSPADINAYSQGPTSALLTFGNVINYRAAETTWCGSLIPAAPDLGSKCNPATVFGVLPARYDQSTVSNNNSFTDVMSVTPQVARRAYLDAAKGNTSTFFYVRRFVSTVGGPDQFVPVTIRLSGNGAGVPLSLTEVKLDWGLGKPVLFVKSGEVLPRFHADIRYTGSGRLIGRWELVKPGEALPEPRDLLTEATLPAEERGTQKHYTEIKRFNLYLPPTGQITLPGPETWRVDESLAGLYLVLLRIEASDDKEGDSDLQAVGAGGRVVHGGAVAGFSMPVLRYYVGTGSTVAPVPAAQFIAISPEEKATLDSSPVKFAWTPVEHAVSYKLEVEDMQNRIVLAAIVLPQESNYVAPPWFARQAGIYRWRVIAFANKDTAIGETEWRGLRIN